MSYTNTLRARGGCQGQGLRLFVFFREKGRERGRGALKSFSFLTRQYFMTSAKGGSCWQRRAGSEGEGCLTLGFSVRRGRCGPCGWAWQHIGTLPDYATEKFIHFLFTFHDKTTRSSRPPSLCTSLTPFLLLATTPPSWQPQHFVIYN